MDPTVIAALESWRFDPGLLLAVLGAAWVYYIGWRRLGFPGYRLACFLAAEAALVLAIASPLDAFGPFLLAAHMVQHLLLIAVAPPLLWLSQPFLPMLRGLPAPVFKEVLGPFLSAPELKRAGYAITRPVFCWVAGTSATILWHLPQFYELGLRSPGWHQVEHACFFCGSLLFWWPVMEVWPEKRHAARWLMLPYLISADLVNSALSAWLVFSTRAVYPSYGSVPRLWGTSAMSDQATAGAIMWVPGSIIYLAAAVAVTMRALGWAGRRPVEPAGVRRPFEVKRGSRRAAQGAMLAVALLTVFDGFFGPQVAPLNLAGVLPWTYWRAFGMVALLLLGNLFCFACPFTLPRDLARRFFRPQRSWPVWLRHKWIAVALLGMFFWGYERFRLWDSPGWTAWIIVSYFVTATLLDCVFQGASFCKYVCPIGQFHFVNSLVSPLEVTVKRRSVCDSCKTHDCLRACGLGLLQPVKSGNFDCTFCLECVPACPSQNVQIAAFVPRTKPERRSARVDAAALTLLVVMGAFVSAAVMTPVGHANLIFGLGFLAAPCAILFASWRTESRFRLVATLVPLGASMWMAHFGYHLLTAGGSIVPVAARWLGTMGAAGPMGGVPGWWPGARVLLLDGGLLLTLYLQWRDAINRLALVGWAALAVCLYAAGLWILSQPMEMRGMLM